MESGTKKMRNRHWWRWRATVDPIVVEAVTSENDDLTTFDNFI
jgi:hypothetical protein